jgi:hypothetical protein
MPHERLRHTLAELHAELEDEDSLDAETRSLLRDAAREIEHALESGTAGEEDHRGAAERMVDVRQHFEATHPRVAEAVQRVLDALAALGI